MKQLVKKKVSLLPVVIIQNQKATTTSLEVARIFEKKHQHVLRDIGKLDLSESFSLSNFGQRDYVERNQSYVQSQSRIVRNKSWQDTCATGLTVPRPSAAVSDRDGGGAMKQIVKKEEQYLQIAKTVIDSWHSCMNVLVEDDAWHWVDEVSLQVMIQISILKKIKQLAIEQDFGNKLPIQ